MKVLLTGATGLVGRHVLEALGARSIPVHAVARRSPAQAGLAAAADVTFHRCDLLSPEGAAAVIDAIRPTHLVHAAWTVEPGRVWWSADNLDWIGATLSLARRFAEAGGRRMLVVGTCAEYDWSEGTCTEDRTPLQAATLYGACKNAAHLALRSYADRVGLSLCWARLFNMYGPHEDGRRLVAGAIAALLAGQPFQSTDGRQLRDFLHVHDVADALVSLLLAPVNGSVNVASGQAVSIAEVLGTVAAAIGRPGLVQLGTLSRPANDVDRVVADVSRLHATGWRPALSLPEGVEQTLAWWRTGAEPV